MHTLLAYGAIPLRLVGVMVSFLLTVYLARTLAKDTLGTYFWLIQLVLIGSVFLRFGADTALLKYGAKLTKSDIKSIVKRHILNIGLPSLSILAVLALALSTISYRHSMNAWFVFLAILPFTVVQILSEYLKAKNRQIVATVLQACLLPILVMSVFYLRGGNIFISYIIANYMLMALCVFVGMSIWRNHIAFGSINAEATTRNYWDDSKTFLVVGLLNITMNSLDVVMLGMMSTNEAVAEYGIANRLVALSSVILVAVNGVVGPRFSELWQNEKYAEIRIYFLRVMTFLLFGAVFIVVVFFVFGEVLLASVYGNQFNASYSLLQVLSIGQAMVLGTGPVAFLLMMTNSKKIHKTALIIAVVSNILLNSMLIPLFGAMGAAVATVVSLVIKNVYGISCLFLHTNIMKQKLE